MNCEQFRDILHDYVSGEVAEVTEALAAEHLAVCPECARAARDMKRTRSLVKQYGAELAPEGFEDAVRARIEAELKARSKTVQIQRRRPASNYRLRLAGLAASLALVVLFGAYLSRMQPGALNRMAEIQPGKDKKIENRLSEKSNGISSPSSSTETLAANEMAGGQTAPPRSAANAAAGAAAQQIAPSAPAEPEVAAREIQPVDEINATPVPAPSIPAAEVKKYTGEGSVVMNVAKEKNESLSSRRRKKTISSSSSIAVSDLPGGNTVVGGAANSYLFDKENLTNQARAVDNAITNYKERLATVDRAAPAALAEAESRPETNSLIKPETAGVEDVAYNTGGDFKPSKFDSDVFGNLLNEAEKDFSAGKSATIKMEPKLYKPVPTPTIILRAQDWFPTSDPKTTVGKCEKIVKEYAAANPGVHWGWANGRLVVQGTYSKLQPLRDKLNAELRPNTTAKSASVAAAPDTKTKTAAKPSAYPPEMPAMFEVGFYQPKTAEKSAEKKNNK